MHVCWGCSQQTLPLVRQFLAKKHTFRGTNVYQNQTVNGTIFAGKNIYGTIGEIDNLLGTNIWQKYTIGRTNFVKNIFWKGPFFSQKRHLGSPSIRASFEWKYPHPCILGQGEKITKWLEWRTSFQKYLDQDCSMLVSTEISDCTKRKIELID